MRRRSTFWPCWPPEKAVREDGENARHRYLYGAVLAELKQYSDAETQLRKAVALEGQNAETLYQLGRVLLEQSQEAVIGQSMSAGVRLSRSEAIDSEGLAILERAVELDGGHLEARVRLGRAYTDQNRYLETLEQFQAVADADPRYPAIHSYLAVLYLKMGRVIQAIRELQTEVEFFPDNAMARLDLGDLLLQLAQPRLALKHLLAAEQESPDTPDLHYALARAYRALGQPGKALASASKCVDLAPDTLPPRYLLAQLYRRNGQSDLARRELSTAERLRNPAWAGLSRGGCPFKKGKRTMSEDRNSGGSPIANRRLRNLRWGGRHSLGFHRALGVGDTGLAPVGPLPGSSGTVRQGRVPVGHVGGSESRGGRRREC